MIINKLRNEFKIELLINACQKLLKAKNHKENSIEGMLLQLSLVTQLKNVFADTEKDLKIMIDKSIYKKDIN